MFAPALAAVVAGANVREPALEDQTGRAIISVRMSSVRMSSVRMSSVRMSSVRVSPTEQALCEPDLLGDRRLERGNSITIAQSDIQAGPSAECDSHDIRLTYSDPGTCTLGCERTCADTPRTRLIDDAEHSGCAMADAFGW